jgi:hypothetical protein
VNRPGIATLLGMTLASVALFAVPLRAETTLVRGKTYILPRVVVCITEEAARQLVEREMVDPFLGDSARASNIGMPPGCEDREKDEFVPDSKHPDLRAPARLLHVHPAGKEICSGTDGQKYRCDTRLVVLGFVIGRIKRPDGTYVRAFVQMHDSITVVDE